MDELADAFLQWRVSSSSLELLRLLLRSYGRMEEAEEIEIELASWLTGAWGGAHVVAGRARAFAERGSAIRRPATRGVHAAVGL